MAQHSAKYDLVLRYYKLGLWDLQRVYNAVKKSWITEDEYWEITNRVYDA